MMFEFDDEFKALLDELSKLDENSGEYKELQKKAIELNEKHFEESPFCY